MCLSVPSRVTATDGCTATVESFGNSREVSLLLLNEPVAVGDYLLIQAGGFAYEKVEAEHAEQALTLIAELSDGWQNDI